MNKISRRAILGMAKTTIGGIINKIPIQQRIVKELSGILEINRCVIFRVDNNAGVYGIEITAGVPTKEHGIGLKGKMESHPDIVETIRRGSVMVITDPKMSPLTVHFRSLIEINNITQILYIPIVSEFFGTIGVIVLDATGERDGFEQEEIEFCGEVGELLSLIMDNEEILRARERDRIMNPIVTIGGFARRMRKITEESLRDIDIILEEARKIEENCPK